MKYVARLKLERTKVSLVFLSVLYFVGRGLPSKGAQEGLNHLQKKILWHANELLNYSSITYVMGGQAIGSSVDCSACVSCLQVKKPAGKSHTKVIKCPVCKNCSLDCSHFTQIVYQRSGLHIGYLTTKQMLGMSERDLALRYKLFVVNHVSESQPGDLLVYKGHVVILEDLKKKGKGDIVHATGGRDIKSPGQGIQRERNVFLSHFRGPLLRILRHKKVAGFIAKQFRPRLAKPKQ